MGVKSWPVGTLLAEPGQWMCNLGFHRATKHGRAAMHSVTTKISDRETVTLHYIECQRCGREYPGHIPSMRNPW